MEQADVLPVAIVAGVETLLGDDAVILKGWLAVDSSARTDGDREVLDLTIDRLEFIGASSFGAVSALERPDSGDQYASTGHVTGMPGDGLFPADAELELFIDLEVPSSPIGDLILHNEVGLLLAASQPLVSWPPLGATFQKPDAAGCIPLLDETNMETDLGACISSMVVQVAPDLPAYSVDRGAAFFHPADILVLTPDVAEPGAGQPPYVGVTCLQLGLTDGGCDDDATQDNINALAIDSGSGSGATSLDFSVAPGSLGVEDSAVAIQNLCPPAKPGISPEPESDIFHTDLGGSNVLRFDGNGPVGACVSAFPLGLLESIAARDDLNALATLDPTATQLIVDAVREGDLYFSLDAASPSLAAMDVGPAAILRATEGSESEVFASAAALGLQPGDDIDGLCLLESGDGAYDSGDSVLFSLAPGSPTLAAIDAGPADVLRPGAPPAIAHPAADLGLTDTDDANALDCGGLLSLDGGSGDVNCDGTTTSVDAALVLQHVAGLLEELPCPDEADVNGDVDIDSRDAALILQFSAGLLLQLPV